MSHLMALESYNVQQQKRHNHIALVTLNASNWAEDETFLTLIYKSRLLDVSSVPFALQMKRKVG
jgi:hypothetical protein